MLDYQEPASWFDQRDEIKAILAEHLAARPTQAWLDVLEAADMWCAAVLDWDTLIDHPQFARWRSSRPSRRGSGTTYETTVCPIRVDGRKLTSRAGLMCAG